MSEQVLDLANQAIFHQQLNSEYAIRYVMHNSGVDRATAQDALKQVMTGYKQRR